MKEGGGFAAFQRMPEDHSAPLLQSAIQVSLRGKRLMPGLPGESAGSSR